MQLLSQPSAVGYPTAPHWVCCLEPPTSGPLSMSQTGAQARRHLLRPEAMLRKQNYPATVPHPIFPSLSETLPCAPPASTLLCPWPQSGCLYPRDTRDTALCRVQKGLFGSMCEGSKCGNGEPHQQVAGRCWEETGQGEGVFPCQELSLGLGQWRGLGMQKDSRVQAALVPVPIT